MLHICPICKKVIGDLDRVRVLIDATYHPLKSTIAYALDKNDMEVVGPLCHKQCYEE
jgi:hypothetical protein